LQGVCPREAADADLSQNIFNNKAQSKITPRILVETEGQTKVSDLELKRWCIGYTNLFESPYKRGSDFYAFSSQKWSAGHLFRPHWFQRKLRPPMANIEVVGWLDSRM